MRVTKAADQLEEQRLALQAQLDSAKTKADRNRLGQFATPTALARDVLAYGLSLLPKGKAVRFLDPAIGTGSFYSALRSSSSGRRIQWARGFEIDAHYGEPSKSLWAGSPLDITIGDFTKKAPPEQDSQLANLLICNPPYVRHHHMDSAEKVRLQTASYEIANMQLSGLAGLYCHFLAISHAWMVEGGVAGWLIPSEFMDVNYGRQLKDYLLRKVTLLHIHRFDPNDVQFDDALVSSAVVWFKREKPPAGHHVTFSYGGSLRQPAQVKQIAVTDLACTEKWTTYPKRDKSADHSGYRLGDLFAIKRGLATGDNDFFILDEEKVKSLKLPRHFLRPILPSARYLKTDSVQGDSAGVPLLDRRLFLLDCDLPEDEVRRDYPALWAYLETGLESAAQRYLCRSRRVWYSQENRQAAPIVCTYIGRSDREGRPFRFILNQSKATATNVFLMLYPKPALAKQLEKRPTLMTDLWAALNQITSETLLENGRVYGGGMHKLEPKELANVPADHLAGVAGL